MRIRDLIVFIVVGLVLAVSLLLAFRLGKPEEKPPPSLAGSPLPDRGLALDLSRRYDASAYLDSEHPMVYRSVRILGIASAIQGDASEALPARGNSPEWLVLELPDKRLVYIPPSAINALEEAEKEAAP